MNVSEVLNRAADLIEERGWWDGGELEVGSPLCASNAIAATAQGRDLFTVRVAAHRVLWEYLGGDHIRTIFDWNDAQADAAPVIEALRAAAVIAAASEVDVATVESEPVSA